MAQASTAAADSLEDTGLWVRWVNKRVWNDREVDAGVLLCALGAWMILWPQSLSLNALAAWSVIFRVAPAWLWGSSMMALGIVRTVSAGTSRKGLAAIAALLCVGLWAAYAAAFWSLSPKSLGGIVWGWLMWQALKSYLRLATAVKLREV